MPVAAVRGSSHTYTMLDASTGHLTARDRSSLQAFAQADMAGSVSIPGMRLVPHQYGWFVILFYPDDLAFRQAVRSHRLSRGFQRLVQKARAIGARGIDFDQDGERFDDVPFPDEAA